MDGCGILHPQRFGCACHLGVLNGLPTIGVSKNVFAVEGLDRLVIEAAFEERNSLPPPRGPACAPCAGQQDLQTQGLAETRATIRHVLSCTELCVGVLRTGHRLCGLRSAQGGELLGAALCAPGSSKKPIYVSVGAQRLRPV